MYEDRTFDFLMNRMIEQIEANYPQIDTREGSMIWDALAPTALELAIAYTELDNIRNETFIATASREGKLKRCLEQGIDISIFDATYGVYKGVFNVQVPIGSRWNLDRYNYSVIQFIDTTEDNNYEYELRCETAGSEPNVYLGNLTPITDTPQGLTYAAITEVLVYGEEEASDQTIEDYYVTYINNRASDGNVAQYEFWCTEYPGVGNFKIFPLWNGPNTVKVSILDSENGVATPTLIEEFQKYLDPDSEGMGNGVAPIGAIVTVTTATEVPINVTAEVTFSPGTDATEDIKSTLEKYFNQIAYVGNSVSYYGVAATILGVPGVIHVGDVTINGGTEDIMLEDEEIPVSGTITITEEGTT